MHDVAGTPDDAQLQPTWREGTWRPGRALASVHPNRPHKRKGGPITNSKTATHPQPTPTHTHPQQQAETRRKEKAKEDARQPARVFTQLS